MGLVVVGDDVHLPPGSEHPLPPLEHRCHLVAGDVLEEPVRVDLLGHALLEALEVAPVVDDVDALTRHRVDVNVAGRGLAARSDLDPHGAGLRRLRRLPGSGRAPGHDVVVGSEPAAAPAARPGPPAHLCEAGSSQLSHGPPGDRRRTSERWRPSAGRDPPGQRRPEQSEQRQTRELVARVQAVGVADHEPAAGAQHAVDLAHRQRGGRRSSTM